ncbi:MAG: hypothetical protein ABF289_14680 [Clostridiales bacterium]
MKLMRKFILKNRKRFFIFMSIFFILFFINLAKDSFDGKYYIIKKTIWVIDKDKSKELLKYEELNARLSITKDLVELIQSESLIKEAKNNFEENNKKQKLPTVNLLINDIIVERKLNSRLMTISYKNKNEEIAKNFLNELIEVFEIESDQIFGVENLFVIDETGISKK